MNFKVISKSTKESMEQLENEFVKIIVNTEVGKNE